MNLKRVHRQGETSGLVNATMEVWVPPFIREVPAVTTAAQQANLECRLQWFPSVTNNKNLNRTSVWPRPFPSKSSSIHHSQFILSSTVQRQT